LRLTFFLVTDFFLETGFFVADFRAADFFLEVFLRAPVFPVAVRAPAFFRLGFLAASFLLLLARLVTCFFDDFFRDAMVRCLSRDGICKLADYT